MKGLFPSLLPKRRTGSFFFFQILHIHTKLCMCVGVYVCVCLGGEGV